MSMNRIFAALHGNKCLTTILDYALLLMGCLILAVSFNVLLLPNKIASGGIVGLSIITKDLFGLNPAYLQWGVNLPIFFCGLFFLGRASGIKSIIGTFTLPFFILLTQSLPVLTHNPLLATLYGGLGLGLGLGLVFRSKGSTGGFSILALILEKYASISIGTAAMMMDGIVIVLAGIVFSPENSLYALLVVYIMSRTIDFIQLGFNITKVILVFSDQHDQISQAVLKLPRGITKIHATGGFTSQDRPVLMIVINQSEISHIKQLILDIDPAAFFVISNAHEVIGQGFSRPV